MADLKEIRICKHPNCNAVGTCVKREWTLTEKEVNSAARMSLNIFFMARFDDYTYPGRREFTVAQGTALRKVIKLWCDHLHGGLPESILSEKEYSKECLKRIWQAATTIRDHNGVVWHLDGYRWFYSDGRTSIQGQPFFK